MIELTETHPRFDFGVGEDASVITLTDCSWHSSPRSLKERIAAAHRAEVVLISLPEDGGISGRIVLGPLTDKENGGWLARATRFLRLDSGQLTIDAGGIPGSEMPLDTTLQDDFHVVQVPPGNYQITLYVMLSSSIATDLFRRRKISYLDWYRADSPEALLPRWVFDIAEERDNEFEDERLERLTEEHIDDTASDDFVEVLIQLTNAEDCAEPSKLEKNGGPKWERRLPRAFPNPPLSSSAIRQRGTFPIARTMATAFVDRDFQKASSFCVPEIRDDVADFLDHQHQLVSEKLTMTGRVVREDAHRSPDEWKLLHDDPRVRYHSMSFLRWPFRGTQAIALLTENNHDPDTYVRFEFAFVSSADGLTVAALMLAWNAKQKRRRRRR